MTGPPSDIPSSTASIVSDLTPNSRIRDFNKSFNLDESATDSLSESTARVSLRARTTFDLKNKEVSASLTINKLDFTRCNGKLYGREAELVTLRRSYLESLAQEDRAEESAQEPKVEEAQINSSNEEEKKTSKDNKKAVVWIHGSSGSGKTALALSLKETVQTPGNGFQRGFFVRTKFDLLQMEMPLSGIVDVTNDLLEQTSKLLDLDGGHASDLAKKIRDSLASEMELEIPFLSGFFPTLNLLVPDTSGHDDESSLGTNSSASGWRNTAVSDRLRFCYRKLLGVVTKAAPIVILFDDVQWADNSSIDMLKACVRDAAISSFLVLCCYRTQEVDSGHPISDLQKGLGAFGTDANIKTHTIALAEVAEEHIEELLADLLSTRASNNLRELASTTHKKTKGDFFCVKHFLPDLQDHGFLTFQMGLVKWTWNIEDIKHNTTASDNVIALLKDKLQESAMAKSVLPVAACLGGSFKSIHCIA